MSKVRVHELAKQLGMESKEVLAKLQEMGEFVRSASSTVEAPVVRKLVALYPDVKPAEEKKPVKKAAAKKSAAKSKVDVDPALAAELAAELGVDLDAIKAQRAAAVIPTPPISDAPATPENSAEEIKPAPSPGNNPFSTGGAVPRPPRPGNNPFSTGGSTSGGLQRPPARPQGSGAPAGQASNGATAGLKNPFTR